MDFRALGMGVAFALMWSSAFTSAKIAVVYAPPFAILSVRFLISGLIAVGIAYALGQRAALTRRQWVAVVLFGLCQNVVYLGANFFAAQYIEASLAVIVASLLPLLVAGANALRGERLGAVALMGLLAGLAGVLVIMGDRLSGGADSFGVFVVVVGVLALTVATLLVQGAAPQGNVIMIVGLQMLVGSAALFPLSLLTETWVIDWQWPLIAAFTYTTLVPGLLATVTWFLLVKRVGPTRAATFHFLNPFLGVAIAAIILGEALSLRDILGVAVIMAGILAVQLSRMPAEALARR
ncbi:DMT family transporter [Pontivivens ytuae]|uniref:DMT family transporter n=1 Tax=Pontivivens ytuae TaxID=2789856 RepID=A0A7S9LV64_9RHOB|nr:DMT family transporter [Pontivivens ytuae]QPH55921.1 DMT family transporter [Pontivivens ytuae]